MKPKNTADIALTENVLILALLSFVLCQKMAALISHYYDI